MNGTTVANRWTAHVTSFGTIQFAFHGQDLFAGEAECDPTPYFTTAAVRSEERAQKGSGRYPSRRLILQTTDKDYSAALGVIESAR